MKKLLSIVLVIVLAFSVFSNAFAGEEQLVALEDFLYSFNFVSALYGTDHSLSLDKIDELSTIGDKALLKVIYNDCEILSLILTKKLDTVIEIYLTLSTTLAGKTEHLDDFLYLFMETLLASGLDAESVSEVLLSFGESSSFQPGDSGEITIDGIRISYNVTSYTGISFDIKKDEQESGGSNGLADILDIFKNFKTKNNE